MNPAATFTCARCRRSTATPFAASGGVCLRCAGERALALDLDETADSVASPPQSTFTSAAPPAPDLPAHIGPYEIIDEIGRGGMGRVFAARQPRLDRLVALKVFFETPGNSGLTARFLREAQTIARLRHPHIVAVHDSGRAEGCVYFSMDYIEGGDLAQRMRRTPLAPRASAALVQKIATALACAHGAGVLHRDLKPSNILLDGDEPRLADFGLAAQLEAGGDLTLVSAILGTPHYLAPEAVKGGSAAQTTASDLYALGTVLYELLAGRTPFAGASAAELPALLLNHDPPPLRLLAPATPRDLATICHQCLETDPARRYLSAEALAADLQRFLAAEPIRARPVSGPTRFLRWTRRRPALAALWFAVVLLAGGSTTAALRIHRERLRADAEAARAEAALHQARLAGAEAREQLRAARLAEARAVRQTTEPGRRRAALTALQQAAAIRPGDDLRQEAIATLLLPDLLPARTWDVGADGPVAIVVAPDGHHAAVETRISGDTMRSDLELFPWGASAAIHRIGVSDARPVSSPRFSRDSRLVLARFSDESLRVWQTPGATPVLTLPRLSPAKPDIDSGAWNDDADLSPDGATLARGLHPRGVAWNRIRDGAELGRSEEGTRFTLLRYSPDGRRVAAIDASHMDERRLFIFDAAAHRLEHVYPLSSGASTLAWSDDSQLIAVAGDDNALVVYDQQSRLPIQSIQTRERGTREIAFLAGGAFVAATTFGNTLQLFNVANSRTEFALGDIGPGRIASETHGRGFFVGSLRGVVTHWELYPPVGLTVLLPGRREGYEFLSTGSSLDFVPGSDWVLAAHGQLATVRDTVTGRLVTEYNAGFEIDPGSSVLALPDGRHVLRTSFQHGLRRHEIQPRATGGWQIGPGETLDAEPGFALGAGTNDRRRLVLFAPGSGDIKVLDRAGGGYRETARWSVPSVYACALSPDGSQLLVNCTGVDPNVPDARLRVYRTVDGSVAAELDAPVSCDAAWSADGRVALTSNGQDESIVWNTADWTRRVTLRGELGGNTTSFGLSADGRRAVIAHGNKVDLVSTEDGHVLLSLTAPGAGSFSTAARFLPDDRRVAAMWPDGRMDIYDPAALLEQLAALGL